MGVGPIHNIPRITNSFFSVRRCFCFPSVQVSLLLQLQKISFAPRIPFKEVRCASQSCTSLLSSLRAPSPRGEGRGGVTKSSMSVSEFLLSAGADALHNIPRIANSFYKAVCLRANFPRRQAAHLPLAMHTPSHVGGGRGRESKNSMSASEFLITSSIVCPSPHRLSFLSSLNTP